MPRRPPAQPVDPGQLVLDRVQPGTTPASAPPDPPTPAAIQAILAVTGAERKDIVAVLRAIQERWHYLPDEALRLVAEAGRISPADLEGVASFYSQFRRVPSGRHTIRVCVGTACFVKGAENIHDAFRLALKIREGADTDREGLFTLAKVACLGCCTLAPVVQIDEAVYGPLSRQKVPSVLADFLGSRGAAEEEEPAVGAALAPGQPGSGRGSRGGRVSVCTCTSCAAAGARAVLEAFRREARLYRLPVQVQRSACPGIAYRAPVAEVLTPEGETRRYASLKPEDAAGVLSRHFPASSPASGLRRAASRLLERLLDERGGQPVERLSLELARGPDGAFWGPQVRVVTAEAPGADPLSLEDYRAAGGFRALQRCLEELSPEEVIDRVRAAGLRGRGGAGYPTAAKWQQMRVPAGAAVRGDDGKRCGSTSPGPPPRYVICNADEGDPGAFMDRMTLESFPYRVIEGLAIAAWAVGSGEGIFFVRSEYPLAIRRIRRALQACTAAGVLGERVLGSDFSLRLEVAESAGAFVCGEETAMVAALEGRRGNPRARPPYPTQEGLWGAPTLVNNVETLAAVPWIIEHGAQSFRALGTPGSPGTKTFALAGKIVRGGLIEVPMGISLRRIVEEIGGGLQGGRRLKAVQIGGPSGGCIPAALADLPVDFESLTAAGAMMGSGGLVVLDETDCMVDVARYFMSFTQAESCGKCTPCRVGTRRMLELLEGLCAGSGRRGDVERLEELARVVQEGSLCALGRTAPNPVLTTLRYFREEYEAHLSGRCPAGRCKALIAYRITTACIGCTRCAQSCPSGAIQPRPYQRHEIDPQRCIRCDTCRQVCPCGAVEVVGRGEIAEPGGATDEGSGTAGGDEAPGAPDA